MEAKHRPMQQDTNDADNGPNNAKSASPPGRVTTIKLSRSRRAAWPGWGAAGSGMIGAC